MLALLAGVLSLVLLVLLECCWLRWSCVAVAWERGGLPGTWQLVYQETCKVLMVARATDPAAGAFEPKKRFYSPTLCSAVCGRCVLL